MAESQKHGFEFEKQIRQTKLNDINNIIESEFNYTDKWDFPPIQIKSFKYKSNTIEFGSLKRMFEKNENFILVLIGYKQKLNIKEVVFSDALFISINDLDILKKDLTLETILSLDEKIKTFQYGDHKNARLWAKEQKQSLNNLTNFDLRFKIDSKSQRRIQCALNLNILYSLLNKNFKELNKLNVENIFSNPRIRKIL